MSYNSIREALRELGRDAFPILSFSDRLRRVSFGSSEAMLKKGDISAPSDLADARYLPGPGRARDSSVLKLSTGYGSLTTIFLSSKVDVVSIVRTPYILVL